MAERHPIPTDWRFINRTGQRFSRLVILRFAGGSVGNRRWLCRCDCGKTKTIIWESLRSGATKSCGCLRKDANVKQWQTHGLARTRIYNTWRHMIQRCTLRTNHAFPQYGGRGIRVCKRWLKIENFVADMGPRPAGKSIDRIDNNGNYEPGNCRWASPKQQRRNTRKTRVISFRGKTQCMADWAADIGITPTTLLARLRLWPIKRALTQLPKL